MTTSAPHKCAFPHTPPHSVRHPGPCECGKTYLAEIARQRAAEAGLAVVDPADLRAALTAKGPLPDGVYDRLAAAAGVTR
jgi:hypothetical protein